MNFSYIATRRMTQQRLIGKLFTHPADVVRWMGAVQSQDYAMAKWAVGLRTEHVTDELVESAFNNGEIVRTHVLRPTWHFVIPEDVGWMLALTGPRVKKIMGHYNRKLELTDALFAKTNNLIATSLRKEKFLTRQQIKHLIEKEGIKTDVQRLAHIVMWAELDGLIVSGPRIGKQFTYALMDDRVSNTVKLNREESLATLATKYFTSHGPAQVQDFSWWSGLSMMEAKLAVELAGKKIIPEEIEEKTYWLVSKEISKETIARRAFFLSIYDEYVISYKDRSALDAAQHMQKMMSMGNALAAVVILDGVLVGTWKRRVSKKNIEIVLNALRVFSDQEREILQKAADEYGKFVGLPVVLR